MCRQGWALALKGHSKLQTKQQGSGSQGRNTTQSKETPISAQKMKFPLITYAVGGNLPEPFPTVVVVLSLFPSVLFLV